MLSCLRMWKVLQSGNTAQEFVFELKYCESKLAQLFDFMIFLDSELLGKQWDTEEAAVASVLIALFHPRFRLTALLYCSLRLSLLLSLVNAQGSVHPARTVEAEQPVQFHPFFFIAFLLIVFLLESDLTPTVARSRSFNMAALHNDFCFGGWRADVSDGCP